MYKSTERTPDDRAILTKRTPKELQTTERIYLKEHRKNSRRPGESTEKNTGRTPDDQAILPKRASLPPPTFFAVTLNERDMRKKAVGGEHPARNLLISLIYQHQTEAP